MAYASWSVVFGEQPSATKWNILGTNDAEFNSLIQRNGTGLNLLDSSGLEILKGTTVASAVNEVTAASAATGNAPSLSATGDDTNISLNLVSKGTGTVQINGNAINAGAWTSYTPTFSNLTVGNATLAAKYQQIGKTVVVYVSIILGGTSSVAGGWSFSLPVTAASISSGTALGSAYVDDPGNATYHGFVSWSSTTTVTVMVPNGISDTRVVQVSNTKPFSFGSGDSMKCVFVYEAA